MKYLSSSELKAFVACPYRYHKTYITDKKKLETTDEDGYDDIISEDYLRFGTYIHKCIERHSIDGGNVFDIAKKELVVSKISPTHYIKGKEILQNYLDRNYDKKKMLMAEKRFQCVLDNGVPIRGTIDRVMEKNSDTIEIIDFKTGQQSFTQEYMSNDLQGIIYTLYAKTLFPNKRIIFTLDNLNYEPISYEYHHFKEHKEYLEQLYTQINAPNDEDYKPQINKFCGWCYQYESCTLMKNLAVINVDPVVKFDPKKLPEYIKRYNGFYAVWKNAEKEVDKFKTFFKTLAEGNGGEYIVGKSKIACYKGRLTIK